MNTNISAEEIKLAFLEEVANEYGFYNENRRVFIERFLPKNADSKDVDVAKSLGKDEQEFRDCLGKICEKFKTKTNKRGRKPQGEAPWQIANKWLWNEKYNEFCQKQSSSQTRSQEITVILEQSIFRNMLDEQRKKLTSNSLMSKNGFRSNRNFDDVYVPLGLVKPKDESKRDFKTFENDPRLGSQFYRLADYEVTEKFSNTEFFDKVLDQAKNHRLAIIGEPGAGKTTLLQKISTWIEENRPDDQIIWVPLAKVKNQSLADYLLDNWLKRAKDVSETTKTEKDALINTFKAGDVWLLLDGVDEMGINDALFNLHEQITGCFLKYAKIILSCRLNVWEAGINHLYDFEVYRNLDFSESECDQFIENWFEDNPTLGKQLITELNQDGKERIRDLVKNPLRLTMICFSWHKNKGNLPNTKAELYRECVDAFYDWQAKEAFSTTPTERRDLNQALGELAKNALEQDSAWFRITHQQIVQYLSAPNEEGLGKKAIELGWLNQVGVSEQNSDNEVYAFFHPSFQEYFAACAIPYWDFFLPRDHVDHPVEGKIYRIFEAQWKQVFLLWLGRADIDQQLEKEALIEALVNFNDQCGIFYYFRAFYIAATGIAEFKDCSLADTIIDVIVELGFDNLYLECIQEAAREILLETDTQKAITALVKIIQSSQDINLIEHIILSLEDISRSNKQVITALTAILKYSQNESVINIIVESLGIIGKGNSLAIKALIELLQSSKNFDLINVDEVIYSLGEIGKGNDHTIIALIELLQSSQDIPYINLIAENLGKVAQDNNQKRMIINSFIKSLKDELVFSDAVNIFLEKNIVEIFPPEKTIRSSYDNSTYSQVPKYSKEDHEKKIVSLIELIQLSQNKATINKAVMDLGKIGQGNEQAITTLVSLFQSSQSKYAAQNLSRIIVKDQMPRVVTDLKNTLLNGIDINKYSSSLFWQCAQTLSYPEFYNAWHSHPKIIHPEILEISPLGNTSITQTLNQQIFDLHSQLKPTEKTYPLVINTQSLEDETDNNSIAQELCNQIYATVFPDETDIPEINNAPQLKRLIPNLKKHLNTQNLALIFHNGEPNESLTKFCKKLTDVIPIKWITEQPIAYGIPPQENLVNILQNWINQLD